MQMVPARIPARIEQGAGEVLKIVLGGYVKNMALGTFFAAQDRVLDKRISS